jgi:hypothetical protein
MKTLLRLALLGSALVTAAAAQTAGSPSTPATVVGPPTDEQRARFADFTKAPPAVQAPVAQAQDVATILRSGVATASPGDPTLARAVATAGVAIVQEGRVARTEVLAERQATLTRLRLAQTETERTRLIEDLRAQTGRRLEEQRETARLVRDRLRQLRDNTTLNRPSGT